MGGMMGNGNYGNYGTTAQSYLWIFPMALITLSVVAIIGVVFYFAYPELKYIKGSCTPQKTEPLPSANNPLVENAAASSSVASNLTVASNGCHVLLKTMTPEEQKVMNVLLSHKGKYLQKYVSKEAALSRLKTHRIIARFAQRGIVTVKEFGNTNEILLSDWVTT
jgi:uncharacterized membrane protein